MKLEISLVPTEFVHKCVKDLTPYLEKSEAWTRGRAKIIDIIQFLYTGQMNLWMVFEVDNSEIKPYGYVITEVKEYPRCRMLVVQYCAGEPNHMQHVEEQMYALLDSYAQDLDCSGIEFFGRPGWGAHCKKYGYKANTIIYEKYFTSEVTQ